MHQTEPSLISENARKYAYPECFITVAHIQRHYTGPSIYPTRALNIKAKVPEHSSTETLRYRHLSPLPFLPPSVLCLCHATTYATHPCCPQAFRPMALDLEGNAHSSLHHPARSRHAPLSSAMS